MSIAQTANVYFNTDGTYRIGKDGSNIVITGGDVIAPGLAPIAAYSHANAAFDAANNIPSSSLISFVKVPATDTTPALDLSTGTYFDHRIPANNVTLSFANTPTNAIWSYSHIYEIYPIAWSLNASTLTGTSYASSLTFYGVDFKTDGTMYYSTGILTSSPFTPYIVQRDLTEAWNVQTSVANASVAMSSITTNGIFGIKLKPDGTMLYFVDRNADTIYQTDLTEAWNVQTIVANTSFVTTSEETSPYDVFLKSDGTVMYIGGTGSDKIHQYSLSEAWNVATASLTGSSNTIINAGYSIESFDFKSDGTVLFVFGGGTTLYSYDLSEAWNVQTISVSPTGSLTTPEYNYVKFKPDGSYFYQVGTSSIVYQYEVGELATVTLPSGLINSPTLTLTQGYKYEYTFITNDGANTYSIIERTENALA